MNGTPTPHCASLKCLVPCGRPCGGAMGIAIRFRLPRTSHVRDNLPTKDRSIMSRSASYRARVVPGVAISHEFALDHDLDLVANDPLAIEHHVERQAEVLPVDQALGAV